MSNTFPVQVPHLFGTVAACQMVHPYDPAKPTCVMVNPIMMTSDFFKPQFQDQRLTSLLNLIAIEPLGHGGTRTNSPTFTFWDTAIMNLQVLDVLGIKGKVCATGTGQGGWIVARMALLAPHRIAGIMPLGTSMDYESPRTRQLGCFNAISTISPFIDGFKSPAPTPEFTPPDEACALAIYTGFGWGIELETKRYLMEALRALYRGDEGRLRLKESLINLRDRDGLLSRLFEIRCPVLWLQGTKDAAYSVATAQEQIKVFANSCDARLLVVPEGQHFLNAGHAEIVNNALVSLVMRHVYGR